MAYNPILARIARQNGGKLLNTAIDTLLPVDGAKSGRPSLIGGIIGAVAVRVATRSVPGAIVVGGAVIAKRLYDRRREKPARPTTSEQKTPPEA